MMETSITFKPSYTMEGKQVPSVGLDISQRPQPKKYSDIVNQAQNVINKVESPEFTYDQPMPPQ